MIDGRVRRGASESVFISRGLLHSFDPRRPPTPGKVEIRSGATGRSHFRSVTNGTAINPIVGQQTDPGTARMSDWDNDSSNLVPAGDLFRVLLKKGRSVYFLSVFRKCQAINRADKGSYWGPRRFYLPFVLSVAHRCSCLSWGTSPRTGVMPPSGAAAARMCLPGQTDGFLVARFWVSVRFGRNVWEAHVRELN